MSADVENGPRLLNPILGLGVPRAQAHATRDCQRKAGRGEAREASQARLKQEGRSVTAMRSDKRTRVVEISRADPAPLPEDPGAGITRP